MRAWLVRAGRHGEQEQLAIDRSCAVVGWYELDDLSDVTSRRDIFDRLRTVYPDASDNRLSNFSAQLWAFVSRIEVGDLIVLPSKTGPSISIGRSTGPYTYRPDFPGNGRHTRPVEWIRTDVPRSAIGQDLLYSLGAFMTVCEIKRNGAASRLAALASTGNDPGAHSVVGSSGRDPAGVDVDVTDEAAPADVEQLATDRIRAFIGERFTGHDLARLVEAILRAQGYVTFRSPPGTDGGIDVLAGGGALGMESPRICVQVKSGGSPVDVKVVRELHGVLTTVQADQGLLVAWSGLTRPAELEARSQFFKLRVWTADDVITAVTDNYDKLSSDLQAELPLKRIWTVVPDSDSDA